MMLFLLIAALSITHNTCSITGAAYATYVAMPRHDAVIADD